MNTTEAKILEFVTAQWGERDLAGVGLKVAEEAGEVAGAIIRIPEGRATERELDEEVGDLLIVLSQIAAIRGTTLAKLRADRFIQIQERAAERARESRCDCGYAHEGHLSGCPGLEEEHTSSEGDGPEILGHVIRSYRSAPRENVQAQARRPADGNQTDG